MVAALLSVVQALGVLALGALALGGDGLCAPEYRDTARYRCCLDCEYRLPVRLHS